MRLKFTIDKKYDLKMAQKFGLSNDEIKQIKFCYKVALEYIKKTQVNYQSSWDIINNQFSDYIKNTTGYDWFYPEYKCVLSFNHVGISNWGTEPKIVRGWDENPYTMRRITAHELIISHYFEIIRRKYVHENLKDGQIWALAEIAAIALTSLTSEIKNYWPWSTEYYTDHNYPHIVDLQNQLKSNFLTRKSFDEYIVEGIKLVKKSPEIGPVNFISNTINK